MHLEAFERHGQAWVMQIKTQFMDNEKLYPDIGFKAWSTPYFEETIVYIFNSRASSLGRQRIT